MKERIKESLSLAGLTDKKKEKVKKFSSEMKRRLNITIGIYKKLEIFTWIIKAIGIIIPKLTDEKL